MAKKLVAQLNRAGVFVGMVEADPSPLEPGVFLLPAGSVDVEVPEHIEGTVRVFRNGFFSYVNKALEPKEASTPLPTLDEIRHSLMADVDNRIAQIYGLWTRFQMAYQGREAAAIAFKEASYEGDVSEWITKFAEPAKLSLRDATDRVLAQAAAMRAALLALDSERMRKYEILAAPDEATAVALHKSIIGNAETIAASIP